jgi:ribosomal protein S18 acetylase RimI-like enzyme
MAIAIRNALSQDFAQIEQISVAAYQEYARALAPGGWEVMQGNLSQVAKRAEVAQLIVAQEDCHLVGTVAYFAPGKSDGRLFPPQWASIRLLAVSPSHRGKGAGRLLTQECIQRAKADGACEIGVHTSELMTVARKMYERMGFQQDIELPPMFGLRYWRYVLPLTKTHEPC